MPVIRRCLPTPDAKPVEKRGYDVRAAAHYMGVSVFQIRRWRDEGRLKSARIGHGNNPAELFDRRDLDALLDRLFAEAE